MNKHKFNDNNYKEDNKLNEKKHSNNDKKIKIFVSLRTDIDSEIVQNSIYMPVRCGAVYDKRKDTNILGDDTGSNISEKKMSYCELTVLYWAWKNQDLDYYGLCHYRRYLSFSNIKHDSDFRNQVIENYLCEDSMLKHGLLSEEYLNKEIEKYDALVPESSNIKEMPTPEGKKKSIIEHWKASRLVEPETVDKVLLLIEEKYPQYYKSAKEYVKGSKYRGYNCFILKKELFNELCEFQFGILFELEKVIDNRFYSETLNRTMGFMGELLFGIYIYHIEKLGKYNISNKQLVFFENTEKKEEIGTVFSENVVPIVIRMSNYEVPYLGIFLKSFINNTSEENNYDLIILHRDISKDNQLKITSDLEMKNNISIRFYKPSRALNDIKFHNKKENCFEESYYSVFLPWILINYKKTLIIDIDIIVKRDLAELFNTDLDGNLAAGVKDIVFQGLLNLGSDNLLEYAKKEMNMEQPYNYINTGVLITDLEKIRNKYKTEEIIDICMSNKFRIEEQDILNVILEKNIKFLSQNWNFYVESHDGVNHCIKMAPQINELEYRNIKENSPYIIHYSNLPKPWSDPEIKWAREFWDLARGTIYYEELISRMINDKIQDIRYLTYEIKNRTGLFDNRSGARRIADKLMPINSKRRSFFKLILPKDSRRWKTLKKIYHFIFPKYKS